MPLSRMVYDQVGLTSRFEASRERLRCSGGFGWGYCEKVPTVTGKPRTYLEPNSDSMQIPIGGRSTQSRYAKKVG